MNINDCTKGMIVASILNPGGTSYKILRIYKNINKVDVLLNTNSYHTIYDKCDVDVFVQSNKPDKTDITL